MKPRTVAALVAAVAGLVFVVQAVGGEGVWTWQRWVQLAGGALITGLNTFIMAVGIRSGAMVPQLEPTKPDEPKPPNGL